MKIVTGFVGRAHITSQDQQRLNRGIVGLDMYVLGVGNEFGAELTESTTITVSDGDGVMQGCQFRIDSGETEDIVMPDGESGMFRNDLIVARYTKVPETGVEDVSLVVLRGVSQETDYTQVLPDFLTGDIDEGDTFDFPLYRVHFSGFTIDDIVPLFMIIPSVDALHRMHETWVETIENELGNTPMGTAAQTMTGAIREHSDDLYFMKLRGHNHVHSTTAAATANQYKELTHITLPENNSGYDIVYRVIGTCSTGWNSSIAGATVGLSLWGNNGYGTIDHINREIISNHVTWTLGMRSIAYVLVPNGSAARDFYLYVRHSVANAPLTDVSLSYEAFTWTKV